MADRAALLLVLGYLGGLGLIAYQLQYTPTLPSPPPEQAIQPLPPLDLPPIAINSMAVYDAVIERPLFSPERRPDDVTAPQTESVAPQQTAAVDTIEGFRLTAVLKDPDSMTALVENQSGETQALHLGDKLGSWQIKEILDDRVVIVSDTRRETLMVHQFDPVVDNKTLRRVPRSINRRLLRTPPRRLTPPSTAVEREPSTPPDKP